MTAQRATRSIRLLMLFAPTLLVVAAVILTTSIALTVQERGVRDATSKRVLSVASSLAELTQVRSALMLVHDDPSVAAEELQPLADVIERAAGVDYVVISDEFGIRITHPTPSERGRHVSTDNSSVLAGETFIGTETGTIGRTLRAKVPVRDDEGEIIGALSVGILESRIAADIEDALSQFLPWTLGALIVGTLTSSLVAALLERRFRLLDTAAMEHEGLRRTSAALQEQSHEFVTRLHVVHGLVSHGDIDDALKYIEGITPVTSNVHGVELEHQPLLRAALDALTAELGANGTRLETNISVTSVVDEEVSLVLTNLCRNSGEAGASVVDCTLIERDGFYYGEILDDGDGIPAAQLERVFTRGFSTKSLPPDSPFDSMERGIGLDLVRRTVTDRGGNIEVGHASSGGARFRFEMEVR